MHEPGSEDSGDQTDVDYLYKGSEESEDDALASPICQDSNSINALAATGIMESATSSGVCPRSSSCDEMYALCNRVGARCHGYCPLCRISFGGTFRAR